MTEIKAIGSLCSLDDNGYMINDSDHTKINPKFQEVIELIKESCLSFLPKEIHSIYIRGSVPRGLDVDGVSDLDAIIVTHSNLENLDLEWVEETEQWMDQKFAFVHGVELGFFPLSEVEESEYCSMIPFILKTYGVCVYGENLLPKLPNYKPDSSLANEHLLHLTALIDQAKHELTGNEDVEDIQSCCSWIMRIIVRAGMALVMVQEKAYTRDLFPAYQLFSKHYPEKEPEMREALWYAINPLSSSDDIVAFLNEFGSWMKAEADRWLDVYNPTRERHLPLS
ncbi:nucleotidyltransferase [Halobacillus fulvus]|nr:nucleotidyltransferase [Halobacillus fulvus]